MWQTWDLLLTSSFPERTCYSASRSVVSWQPLAVSSFHNLLCVGAEVTLFMRLAPEAMTERGSSVRTGHSHPTGTLGTGHQSSVLPLGCWESIALCPLPASILLTPLWFYEGHTLRKPFLLLTLSHHLFKKELTIEFWVLSRPLPYFIPIITEVVEIVRRTMLHFANGKTETQDT